jgi:hypothetical protein
VEDYGLIHPKAGEPRVFGDCDGNISFMEDDFHEEGEDRIGFGGRLEVSEVFVGPEGLLLREAACGDGYSSATKESTGLVVAPAVL